MHQMKRYVIDGVKEVALKEPTPDAIESGEDKIEECTFEQAEVYAVDVALSTGEGKPRQSSSNRTTVYRRNVEAKYQLRQKASRALLGEVDRKYPALPFTLAHFEDERAAKLGVTECLTQSLQLEKFSSSKVQTQPARVNRSVFNKNSVISQK